MSDDPKQILVDLNKGFEAAQAKQAEIESEVKRLGSIDVISREELDAIKQSVLDASEKNDALVLEMKRRSRMGRDNDGNEIDLDQKAHDWAKGAAKHRGEVVEGEFSNEQLDEYKSAMMKLVRKGDAVLGDAERKALSVGSDADGGYFVHPDMSGRMVQKQFETSPMRAYASVQTISTDTLKGVYDNDEAEIFWEGETQSPQTGDTPQVGEWAIPVHEMRTILRATQKQLEDAEINAEEWLINKGGSKMARAENTTFVTGTGVGRPRGILTYPDGTDLTNSIQRFKTGVDGDFAAAPNGTDKLRTMMASLKSNYRGAATFFMNRTTEGEVLLLKDSDGRPLWQPSVQAGTPSALMGRPIALFEDMPDTDTGALAIAYGDMRQAYQVVDRLGISILRDPFSYKPYVGFYLRKRVGGDVINGEALKLLEFSA